jgi:glutamyl-tRNA synthetase
MLLGKDTDAKIATQILEDTLQKLQTTEIWDAESLESVLRQLGTELELSTGKFFGLLRIAITGRTAAPPLFQTMAILGKERSLKRLREALQRLSPS